MWPWSSIACSTSLRRALAASGWLKGLSSVGAWGRPASRADSGSVRLRGALVVEDPRGRLDADRRLAADRAVGHVVEVLVEDPLLAVDLLELVGHLGLADLALQRLGEARVGRVEVAHQLHGQRRAALLGLVAGDVLDRGAGDAHVVDAAVVVEALVLDVDRRLLDDVGDRAAGHRAAQHVGGDEAQARAVGRVDRRDRALRLGLELGDVGRALDHVDHPGGSDGRRRQRRDRRHAEHQGDDAHHRTPVVAGVALTSSGGHWVRPSSSLVRSA